jgi:predicted nuclease of restriction endonuclease-like (RecB) superfamily
VRFRVKLADRGQKNDKNCHLFSCFSILNREFPGVGGFSAQNLWYMRQFYLEYHELPKLQPLVGEIGWKHNLVIMGRCKDHLEREFYIRMVRKFGWSKNVLIHQIENQTFEKSMRGQTNFDQSLTPELRAQAKLAVKDEYQMSITLSGSRQLSWPVFFQPALHALVHNALNPGGLGAGPHIKSGKIPFCLNCHQPDKIIVTQ